MPGSQTARRPGARSSAHVRVAFRHQNCVSTRIDIDFCGSMAGLCDPLSTLRRRPRGRRRDMVTRIFNTAGLNRPSHLLEKLPEERAIRLLGGAHPDRRAEIFRSLSREAQGRLFDQLNEDAKTSLSRILKYPADQAGSIMTSEFVSVPASWMVKQVIDHIRSSCAQAEQIYAVYLVDPAISAPFAGSFLA